MYFTRVTQLIAFFNLVSSPKHLWSQRFFFRCEERERSTKRKPLVAGDANLTIMLWQLSRESINKQPITTHLSVNKSQSEYTYKVPPIRRQGQILTLIQSYWHGKISQLPRATRGFLAFLSSLLFWLLHGSSLRKPLVARVICRRPVQIVQHYRVFHEAGLSSGWFLYNLYSSVYMKPS